MVFWQEAGEAPLSSHMVKDGDVFVCPEGRKGDAGTAPGSSHV